MKDNVTSIDELTIQVRELEAAEIEQTTLLKAQALKVLDGFKPSSILKSTITEISSSGNLKAGAIDVTLGVGAGWLVRKLFQAHSKNIFRKLAGVALQTIATGIITRKLPQIRHKISGSQEP